MNEFMEITSWVSEFALGIPLMFMILGVGCYMTVRLSFLSWRRLGTAFRLLWQGRTSDGKEGEISPFSALMTALSATVGTGNIVGVAAAIAIGGPGALFWMWVSALIGMATKYSEAVLAVHFRERDEDGNYVGGPMYYIRNGLGKRWLWLATCFALFGACAAFGIGNLIQSNSIAGAVQQQGVPPWATGLVLMVLIGAVILGGVKRIAVWASLLVPASILIYMGTAILVILLNISSLPGVIQSIFVSAFTGHAATGGFVGATIWAALRFGIGRGVFSNEAGLGSAAIAHAAAITDSPVRQGNIAMLGTFIDTILACSMTGFVILTSGVWMDGQSGVYLSLAAFNATLPGSGLLVTFSLIVFGFTTMLGWSYYGERCWQYLFGVRAVQLYRVLYVLVIMAGCLALTLEAGAQQGVAFVWELSSILNTMMAFPNIVALILLSSVVVTLTRQYEQERKSEQG